MKTRLIQELIRAPIKSARFRRYQMEDLPVEVTEESDEANTLTLSERYTLEARFRVVFNTCPEERDTAHQIALMDCIDAIYGDVRRGLDELGRLADHIPRHDLRHEMQVKLRELREAHSL